MRNEKVTCDGCGADLTVRTNSIDYRLTLMSEQKPGYGSGFYTDMTINYPIDRDHHFCRLECMGHWRAREKRYHAIYRSHLDKWIDAHRIGISEEMMTYTAPPQEMLDEWRTKSREIADEEFPKNFE